MHTRVAIAILRTRGASAFVFVGMSVRASVHASVIVSGVALFVAFLFVPCSVSVDTEHVPLENVPLENVPLENVPLENVHLHVLTKEECSEHPLTSSVSVPFGLSSCLSVCLDVCLSACVNSSAQLAARQQWNERLEMVW